MLVMECFFLLLVAFVYYYGFVTEVGGWVGKGAMRCLGLWKQFLESCLKKL